jgi:hypothetical protein
MGSMALNERAWAKLGWFGGVKASRSVSKDTAGCEGGAAVAGVLGAVCRSLGQKNDGKLVVLDLGRSLTLPSPSC